MTTRTRSVAVVATRLPDIDRRALSQAWYSALHLAAAPSAPRPPQRTAPARFVPHAANVAQNDPVPPLAYSATSQRSSSVSRTASGSNAAERRGPASDLARRIERALIRRAPNAAPPSAFALKTGDGRIQLLVRSDATTTRIVALCAPHLRERVERALAHARFALAANGTRVEVTAS